jgi:hypothetical protein
MAIIEKQAGKDLAFIISQLGYQILADSIWVGEGIATLYRLFQMASPHFQHCLELGKLGLPQAGSSAKVLFSSA